MEIGGLLNRVGTPKSSSFSRLISDLDQSRNALALDSPLVVLNFVDAEVNFDFVSVTNSVFVGLLLFSCHFQLNDHVLQTMVGSLKIADGFQPTPSQMPRLLVAVLVWQILMPLYWSITIAKATEQHQSKKMSRDPLTIVPSTSITTLPVLQR